MNRQPSLVKPVNNAIKFQSSGDEELRQTTEKYANDLREMLKKLLKMMN